MPSRTRGRFTGWTVPDSRQSPGGQGEEVEASVLPPPPKLEAPTAISPVTRPPASPLSDHDAAQGGFDEESPVSPVMNLGSDFDDFGDFDAAPIETPPRRPPPPPPPAASLARVKRTRGASSASKENIAEEDQQPGGFDPVRDWVNYDPDRVRVRDPTRPRPKRVQPKRLRVRPIAYWKGEKAVYRNRSSSNLPEIIKYGFEETPRPKKKRKP